MNATAADIEQVTFYFDPACPWTWLTSRWLVEAAGSRGVPVVYAPFELSAGRPLDQVPEEHRGAAATSRSMLRVVAQARREGQHELVGRWYTTFGNERWNRGAEPSSHLARATLESVGGGHLVAALDDPDLDDEVEKSRGEAVRWAGDDAGSPVTFWSFEGGARGFFGPVVAPAPTGRNSDALWTAMVNAAMCPELFELKTRRTHPPTPA